MGTKSLLMAMAALTIAGCSQNEVTEINPDADRTIGLDVYTGVQTRGTETTTSMPVHAQSRSHPLHLPSDT